MFLVVLFLLLRVCVCVLSQLSYTVVGEEWKAERAEDAAEQNDAFGSEWDQDAGDTVLKEVTHDRKEQ